VRDAWQRTTQSGKRPERRVEKGGVGGDRSAILPLLASVSLGVVVGMIVHDLVLGVVAGSLLFAVVTRLAKAKADRTASASGRSEAGEERDRELVGDR
jgi:hypothetical protein